MQQAESYKSVQTQIQAAIEVLQKRDVVNIAAAARNFNLPEQRLRARWNGRLAKSDLPGPNKRLTEAQELAVCMYLDRLDAIGAQARMKMVTSCANHILAREHTDPDTEPPVVGEHWAQRFLDRHPKYYVVKANTMDIDRKLAHDPPPGPPTTPPPPDAPEVPLTIRSLKRQFHSVYNEVCHLEGMTPSLKRRLKTALNGGLVQAHAGAEAAAEIKATQEAEAIRRKRTKRTHLQRGGVLYAEEARDMVVRRDEDEAKKAREALERAQTAIKRAAKAERKRFLDAVKESRKKILASSSRKKLMKALCVEVRKEGRKRAKCRKEMGEA